MGKSRATDASLANIANDCGYIFFKSIPIVRKRILKIRPYMQLSSPYRIFWYLGYRRISSKYSIWNYFSATHEEKRGGSVPSYCAVDDLDTSEVLFEGVCLAAEIIESDALTELTEGG